MHAAIIIIKIIDLAYCFCPVLIILTIAIADFVNGNNVKIIIFLRNQTTIKNLNGFIF